MEQANYDLPTDSDATEFTQAHADDVAALTAGDDEAAVGTRRRRHERGTGRGRGDLRAPAASTAHGAKRKNRARKPILIAVAVVVALLAAAGGTLAALTKTVTVTVDGASKQVTTLASDVEGALSAANVSVGAHDTLAPAGGTSISDGSQIVVQHGRLFSATIDGKKVSLWTTATTVDQAMAVLGRNAADFKLSADRSREIPLSGLTLTAQTLHDVSLANRGGKAAKLVHRGHDGGRAARRAGDQGHRQGPGVPAAQHPADRRHRGERLHAAHRRDHQRGQDP